MPENIKLLFHFVIHMLLASVLFAAVTSFAFGLWWFTEWLKSLGAPYPLWIVCYGISELVFWLDALCFLVYVGVEAYNLIREIFDGI